MGKAHDDRLGVNRLASQRAHRRQGCRSGTRGAQGFPVSGSGCVTVPAIHRKRPSPGRWALGALVRLKESLLAVFVAAIADKLDQVSRFREDRLDGGQIIGIECKAEDTRVVGDVLSHS